MSFTLRWKNPNAIATTVNIYRDTKDISAAALPAPIVTLTNGETEWRDTTAVNGQTYYYLATVTANGKTVAGASQKYTVAVQRGIGPMGFISGDDELGFMGVVPYDERWLPSQMPASFLSMYPTAFTDRIELYKFSRHGKILYMLGAGVIGALGWMDWASLYQAGLVFGRDDAGPEGANGTLPATPQDAKILHRGDVYRMRLPRGLTDNDQSPVFPFNAAYDQKNHDDFPELTGFNEYNDLYYTMTYDTPEKKRWPSWNHLSPGYLGYYATPTTAAYYNGGVLCMERDSANERVLHRGINNNEGSAVSTSASVMQRINYRARGWQGRYLPIFELVE